MIVLSSVAKSCLTLRLHGLLACQAPLYMGILQARILEWVAMPSSRGSSQPSDRTHVSCIAGETHGYLIYVKLYTCWLESQMLNSELQKVIELTQKGNCRILPSSLNLKVKKNAPANRAKSPKSHTQNISSKNQFKICCMIM